MQQGPPRAAHLMHSEPIQQLLQQPLVLLRRVLGILPRRPCSSECCRKQHCPQSRGLSRGPVTAMGSVVVDARHAVTDAGATHAALSILREPLWRGSLLALLGALQELLQQPFVILCRMPSCSCRGRACSKSRHTQRFT